METITEDGGGNEGFLLDFCLREMGSIILKTDI